MKNQQKYTKIADYHVCGKRWVLRDFLNVIFELDDLMFWGRLFHIVGAVIE